MSIPTLRPVKPAPRRGDPENVFESQAAEHLGSLVGFSEDMNAVLPWMQERMTSTDQRAAAAQASSTAAAASESAAAESAVSAAASVASAGTQATAASDSAAASAADRAAINQALQDLGGLPVYYGTHADALAASVTLPAGTPIVIGADERWGNRRTLNRVAYGGGDSLSLDFTTGIYQVDDMVEFIGYVTPQMIDVPASATAFGFAGAFAVDANYLYVGIGTNSWKRIALGSF